MRPVLLSIVIFLSLASSLFSLGGSGSYFDVTILPILLLASLYRFCTRKTISLVSLFVFFFVLLVAVLLQGPVVLESTNILAYGGKILSFAVLLVWICDYTDPNLSAQEISIIVIIFSLIILALLLLSVAWSYLSPYSNGLSFPFYVADAARDRHVYGPSICCVGLTLCQVSFRLRSIHSSLSILKSATSISFLAGFSSLFISLLSGSRSPLMIVTSFLCISFLCFIVQGSLKFSLSSYLKTLLKLSIGAFIILFVFSLLPLEVSLIQKYAERSFDIATYLTPGADASRGEYVQKLTDIIDVSYILLPLHDYRYYQDSFAFTFISLLGLAPFVLYVFVIPVLSRLPLALLSTILVLCIFGSNTLLIARFEVLFFASCYLDKISSAYSVKLSS